MNTEGVRTYARKKLRMLHSALEARRESGKGLLGQLCEILSFRLGKQGLTVSEYYTYGLYDDTRFTQAAKRLFGGQRVDSRLDRALNDRKWHCLAQDKIITYLLLDALGLPYPRLQAVFDDAPRFVPGVPCLTTAGELRAFFTSARFPLFAKPVGGSFGRGALAIRGFDYQGDKLELSYGDILSVEAFLQLCRTPQPTRNHGYLFQELIEPHPYLTEVCGNRLCSVRIVVILTEAGPQVFGAALKVPTGANVTDNFVRGESGNMVGEVDIDEGSAGRMLAAGPAGMRFLTSHPDTGVPFGGLRIPAWESFVEVALTGASALPGLRYQHWDVAISARGPVVLELNVAGELALLQRPSGRGWLVGPLRDVIDRL